MKLDAKLREEDINTAIKCEEYCILVLEYIEKSLDGLRCDLDKYRDIQKEIVTTLVRVVKIIKQVVNRLHPIFCFAINSFRRIKKPCLFVIKLSNKLIRMGPI